MSPLIRISSEIVGEENRIGSAVSSMTEVSPGLNALKSAAGAKTSGVVASAVKSGRGFLSGGASYFEFC